MDFIFTLLDIFLLIIGPIIILIYEVNTFREGIINKIEKDNITSPFYGIAELVYLFWIISAFFFLEQAYVLYSIVILMFLGSFFKKYYNTYNKIDTIVSLIAVGYVVAVNFKYF